VLYAISAGTVDLKVVAGDPVKQGQELAVIDSPELRSKLAQEQATLAGLEAEPAVPRSTWCWHARPPASRPIRPASTARPPTATWSATSAA
jgi:multidrug efflux pump subunit AcrA (membrane-fusion protein)